MSKQNILIIILIIILATISGVIFFQLNSPNKIVNINLVQQSNSTKSTGNIVSFENPASINEIKIIRILSDGTKILDVPDEKLNEEKYVKAKKLNKFTNNKTESDKNIFLEDTNGNITFVGESVFDIDEYVNSDNSKSFVITSFDENNNKSIYLSDPNFETLKKQDNSFGGRIVQVNKIEGNNFEIIYSDSETGIEKTQQILINDNSITNTEKNINSTSSEKESENTLFPKTIANYEAETKYIFSDESKLLELNDQRFQDKLVLDSFTIPLVDESNGDSLGSVFIQTKDGKILFAGNSILSITEYQYQSKPYWLSLKYNENGSKSIILSDPYFKNIVNSDILENLYTTKVTKLNDSSFEIQLYNINSNEYYFQKVKLISNKKIVLE